MALWKVFIDDSADQKKKQFVVAGMFVGRLKEWHSFQRKWNKKCRENPRIQYFHGKELRSLSKQFAQFQDKSKWPDKTGIIAANAKRDALRKVIHDSGLVGLGLGLYVPLYETFRASTPLARRLMGKDAFEYILQAVFWETTKHIIEVDERAKVAFVSDLSNKSPRYIRVFNAWKKANPNTAKHILGIDHLNDERWPGLQAADMAASSVKTVFEEHLATGKKIKDFPLAERFYKMGNIDETYIRAMLKHHASTERQVLID
jgi:hypothetical protein